ncbi:MAG: response regulator [Planctomycetes bacterium]|nr:response regulator [Planctomycetota bacterium]
MLSTHHLPHKRILIVEDCFRARELMSLILGENGYMVSTAANGAEAIERLRTSSRPDLILLDLRMPVMDGWTLREELKRDPELSAIPVVVLSGVNEGEEQTSTLEAARFLHKPIETDELLLAVRQCCSEPETRGEQPAALSP